MVYRFTKCVACERTLNKIRRPEVEIQEEDGDEEMEKKIVFLQ